MFLASADSEIRLVNMTFTRLNWFHISLEVTFSKFSTSSLSLAEAALSLCDLKMLSSVNLAQVSGTEMLRDIKTGDTDGQKNKEILRYTKTRRC